MEVGLYQSVDGSCGFHIHQLGPRAGLLEGVKVTHMWKSATAASVKVLTCKFSTLPPSMLPLSLMQVVTLTTLQRLDQTRL